jgi:hypothetical protein
LRQKQKLVLVSVLFRQSRQALSLDLNIGLPVGSYRLNPNLAAKHLIWARNPAAGSPRTGRVTSGYRSDRRNQERSCDASAVE